MSTSGEGRRSRESAAVHLHAQSNVASLTVAPPLVTYAQPRVPSCSTGHLTRARRPRRDNEASAPITSLLRVPERHRRQALVSSRALQRLQHEPVRAHCHKSHRHQCSRSFSANKASPNLQACRRVLASGELGNKSVAWRCRLRRSSPPGVCLHSL